MTCRLKTLAPVAEDPEVSGGAGAGRSAEDRARWLRGRAAKLEVQAGRWEQGAAGERRTAAVLDPRSGDGWYVLHDLAVPGSAANIDHVVVTAAGVFVVDSKDWSSPVSAGRGTLWVGRYPKSRELATVGWELGVVHRALGGRGQDVPCRAVISLTAARSEQRPVEAQGVTALNVDQLVSYLASRPSCLAADQVRSIAVTLDAALAPKTGDKSAIVAPAPPGAAPPAAVLGVGKGAVLRAGSPSPTLSFGYPSKARRRRSAPNRDLGQLLVAVAAIALVGIGLKAVSAVRPHTTSSRTSQHSPMTPAALTVSWTCPRPGYGWTAVVQWPAAAGSAGTIMLPTAPASRGPWTIAKVQLTAAPSALTGIADHSRVWLRGGSEIALIMNEAPIVEGQLTAPAGSC